MKKPKFKPGDVVWFHEIIGQTSQITGATVLSVTVIDYSTLTCVEYWLTQNHYTTSERNLFSTFEECKAASGIV